MATDFNTNIYVTPYGFRPETENTPLDGRTVVNTFDDISSIPNPFLGMQVFVKDSGELYLVKQIDEREAGLSVEYFINISTDEDKERSLARMASSDNIDSIVGPVEGVAYLTSYVFTKSTSVPAVPEGGCFTFPYPTFDGAATGDRDENGHDTVPSDGIGAVYMTYRTFCSDPANSGEGTEPRKLADSANFQVEFTANDLSTKTDYVISTFTGNEAAWRQIEEEKGVTGGDETDIENPIYMATAVCHNDVWENGTVVKIKGEKGDKGDKGESAKVSFKGKFSDLETMVAEGDVYRADKENYSPDYDTNRFLLPLEVGDGYIVETNGCLYVYNGEDSEFDAVWTNVGQIQGESAYLYVRYSNNSDGSEMGDPADDSTPGKYIGIKASSTPLNATDLANPGTFAPWTYWRGDDGGGYEQVFLLTHKTNGGYTETNGPVVPTDRQDTPDYLPLHDITTSNVMGGASDNTRWSDRPLSTSETWPLCWVVTRKVGKEYTDGKGDSNNKAILYSKYSIDGIPGTSPFYLELTNDRADIPLENGIIDPEFKETHTVTTTMQLFEGSNPLTTNVTYSISPAEAGLLDGATLTIDLNNIDDVNEVECIATYNNKPYSRSFKIYKTNNAYEIVPSESVLVKDESGNITSTSELTVIVNKGDSLNNKGIVPTNKTLFVKYYFAGTTSPETVSKSISNPISITLKEDLSAIRFYITADDTEEGEEISHEQIGVIANVNGTDGSTYKTSYAFTRCADEEIANVTLSGGNGDAAIPDSTALNGKTYTWEDTVPAGEDAIWVTTRQFKYGDETYDPTGSSPKKMSDSADFEVEFSAGLTNEDGTVDIETKPTLKSLNEFDSIDEWKADDQHKDWNWVDGSQAAGVIWMATAVKHGATGTDGSVVKVKGEKGERGADGTSVNIKGTKTSVDELNTITDPQVGDGGLIDGYLYVYTEEGTWENVGKIQGPAGSSMYLYVRCSDTEGDSKILLAEGQTGKYIGYYVSLEPLTDDDLQLLSTNNKFTGTKGTGEDGGGYEQIYLLTTGANYSRDKGPSVPDEYNDPTKDFLPEHNLGTEAIGGADDYERGSDVPLVPTEDYPYCWELKRKVSGLVDGKGTNCGNWMTDAGGCAILYDRYVTDGINSVHLELSNTFAAVPCDENGIVDSDLGIDLASTGLQLYDGGVEVPDSEVTYDYVAASGFTANCEGKTVTVTSLTSDYVFVACKATYKEVDYFKNFRVQKRNAAWRLCVDGSNVIKKSYDSNGNLQILTDPIGFRVEKWNDIKWEEDTTKTIFVSYSINGTLTVAQVTNNAYDFSGVDVNATDFRAFITDNNTEDGMMLDIEHIGFVIDGKDGENGKDTYSIELTNDLGIISLESNGAIDKQAEDVNTQIIMLKGNVIIDKDDNVTYSINVETSNAISFDSSTGLLTIYPGQFTSASDIPTSITCSATHGEVTLEKTFHLNVTQNAYELIPHKHMLQRDLSTGLLVEDDQTLNVSIRKGNSTTNVGETPTQTLYVHVDCEHIGTPNHTTNVYNSTNSGEVTLDLSNEQELKSIRLYLSATNSLSDAKTNYLTYENLGVYANGEDGSEIEFIYYLTDKEELPLNPTPKSTNLSNNSNYQISEGTPSKYLELIDSSTYTNKDESVVTTAIAAKGTDNPQGVSETIPYQYVAQRRKVGGFWEAFSTPTLWSSYGQKGEQGEQGEQGSPGSDAIVTQLTNPASIIMIVDGAFAQTTASTGLQVRKGSEFVQVTDVTIYKGWLDGVESDSPTSYLASITPELDTTSEYSDNNLVFTIKDDILEIKSQVIKLRLKIVTTEGTFYEDKTINILESGNSGKNAVHLELTNDMDSVKSADITSGVELGISTTATLYDGTTVVEGTDAEGSVEGNNCTGLNETVYNTHTVTVNSITDQANPISVKITATYNGEPYAKTFTIVKSESEYKLILTPSVINSESPSAITGQLLIDGQFVEQPSGVNINYYIDDNTTANGSITNTGSFTIPLDTVETIVESIRFDVHAGSQIVESETIGIIKNGEQGPQGDNAHYYQIEVNHNGIVKDKFGNINSPTDGESIIPYFKEIDGNDTGTVMSIPEGFKLYTEIDGVFNVEPLTESTMYFDTEAMKAVESQITYYMFKDTVTPISGENCYDYVEINVVNETAGTSGPVIYPAGEWSDQETYVGTSVKAPYVFYNNGSDSEYTGYYIAYGYPPQGDDVGEHIIENPDGSEITSNGGVKMESYSAIYSDIGVFNHALVGKGVFHGDYMFSQDGHLGNPESGSFGLIATDTTKNNGEECNYGDVLEYDITFYNINGYSDGYQGGNRNAGPLYKHIEAGSGVPNICFNAVTGEGWFAGKKVYFNESGDLMVGYFKVDDNGFKYESPDGNIIYFSKEGLIISDSNNSSKSAIRCDGSGYLANEAISGTTNGDLTIDGSIFNPVSTTPTDALNKTVTISSGLTSARSLSVGDYDSTKVSLTNPIRKVGTVTVMSVNTNSPSDIRLSSCTLSIPSVIGTKTGTVNSLMEDFNRFVLAPSSIVMFDVYDNYTKSARILIPQITFGGFNHNGEIVPYSCSNNVSYEALSSIITYPNSIGTSLTTVKILDLPEQIVKYMSVKLSEDLNSTYGYAIFFGKYTDTVVSHGSLYSSSSLTTETYISPTSVVSFREGGSFGFGIQYSSAISDITSPTITFKFYNDISMIGQIAYTL